MKIQFPVQEMKGKLIYKTVSFQVIAVAGNLFHQSDIQVVFELIQRNWATDSHRDAH